MFTTTDCITGTGSIISGAAANTEVNENTINPVTSADENETYKVSYTGSVGGGG